MKKILILIILVLVGGYWWMNRSAEAPVESGEKLDMAVVCESALAYMSFPDAAAAELFVSDCKEGKYPEVIERYKADMGLEAGAQI